MVELLRPEHPGQRLASDQRLVRRRSRREEGGVELVGLGLPGGQQLIEVRPGRALLVCEAELDDLGRTAGDLEAVAERRLGPGERRVHCRGAGDDVVVDPVFRKSGTPGHAPEPLGVGLVVAEERLRRDRPAVAGERHPAEGWMVRFQRAGGAADLGLRLAQAPRPVVAEPERRQDVKLGRIAPRVADRNPDRDVVRRLLREVGRDLPVTRVEDPAVEELELGVGAPPTRVLGQQTVIRKGGLRVEVAPAHPGVGRSRIEIEPVLLDVLSVIPFVAVEPEEPLFQDRVGAVPESQAEAEELAVVAEAGQSVLVPAVDAGAGMVVREEIPGRAVRAVVLPHGAPAALAQVGPPLSPRRPAAGDLGQAGALGCGQGSRNVKGPRMTHPRALS